MNYLVLARALFDAAARLTVTSVMQNFRFRHVIRLTVVFSLTIAWSASLPVAPPQQAGFSSERLNRINTVMRQHVEAGRLAGASGLIARNGKVVFRESWGEMKLDSIVRMYSMTKGVTGVAAMIETMPLERAAEAYARMMSGNARFRVVLTMQ